MKIAEGSPIARGAFERRFLLSLVAGTPEWAALGIAHLEQLPGMRWKLHNLLRLRQSKASRFAEQSAALRTRVTPRGKSVR